MFLSLVSIALCCFTVCFTVSFFFNYTATPQIYTLSLHDALPISDVLNSRDDDGTNISPTLNLLVNDDGSLSPFVLPGADERTAWGVDAWLKLGPFDLNGEYRSEEHTSELQSRFDLVCRLLLEKKK